MVSKEKKPVWKKWWFWVIVIVIIGAIGSRGGDEPALVQPAETGSQVEAQSNQGEATQEQSNQESESTSPEPKEEPKEFKVGDTIQLDDYTLTVNDVKKSNGQDFDKPKSGMEYVIVTVTMKNIGSDNVSYNPFDFKMSNSQGQLTDKAFTIVDADTSLESGELAPGGTVSGTISFEQPKDDPNLQLQFKPNLFSDDMIIVNLQ